MARLLSALLILAAACSAAVGPSTTTTVVPGAASPQQAVQSWLAAVSTGRYDDATDLVPRAQLIAIIGVENGLDHRDIAAMVTAGAAADVYRDYWAGFEESFAEASGLAVAALDTGDVAVFTSGGRSYAAVEVFFSSRIGSTELIAVDDGTGWRLDLMAVIGPSLVRPMRALLVGLPQTEEGDVVRDLLEAMTPSLRAALARPAADDLPLEFRAELVQLIDFLEG